MGGSKDQLRGQFGIECPEEELDASRIDRCGVHRLVWVEHTGEWGPKEVTIVRFKTPPNANILRQVFSKLHQDMCKGLALSAGEMERLIRQRTLGFGEESIQVLGDFRQRSFTASKTSLGSMVTKIHGETTPLATCRTMYWRALSVCQRHVGSLRLVLRWIWSNRVCLIDSRFSGWVCSSWRSSNRSWTSPRSSKSGIAKA